MKIRLLAVAAAGAAALSGAAVAQDYPLRWTPAGTVTPTPAPLVFLTLAGASDLYEIQSSQLVLESTNDAALRSFAQMMVDHHTKTSQDAMAAAQRDGITPPPPMLARPQANMIAALQRFDGVERDRLYLTQQMMAHKEALGVMQTYAESGETPALRTAAAATVPIIQRHLAEIERLSRR